MGIAEDATARTRCPACGKADAFGLERRSPLSFLRGRRARVTCSGCGSTATVEAALATAATVKAKALSPFLNNARRLFVVSCASGLPLDDGKRELVASIAVDLGIDFPHYRGAHLSLDIDRFDAEEFREQLTRLGYFSDPAVPLVLRDYVRAAAMIHVALGTSPRGEVRAAAAALTEHLPLVWPDQLLVTQAEEMLPFLNEDRLRAGLPRWSAAHFVEYLDGDRPFDAK